VFAFLTFTEPDKLLILAHLLSRILPVRSLLEHSKDLWIAKIVGIVDFDLNSGQPSVPPRALDVHGRTDVTFSVIQSSASVSLQKFGLALGRGNACLRCTTSNRVGADAPMGGGQK